jgi:hypothetical protein
MVDSKNGICTRVGLDGEGTGTIHSLGQYFPVPVRVLLLVVFLTARTVPRADIVSPE